MQATSSLPTSGIRWQFVIGGLLLLAAVVYLIVVNTQNTAQYFFTVDELLVQPATQRGKPTRISGAVLGDSIRYNIDTLELRFRIVSIPGDQADINAQGGLAAVLHNAVNNPTAAQIEVRYVGEKPDLLRNEAQAILDGTLDENGVFQADSVQLKCPTRYENALPQQAAQPTGLQP